MIGFVLGILDWFTQPRWSWERMDAPICFMIGALWIYGWGYVLDWWDAWRARRAARPKKAPGRHAMPREVPRAADPAPPVGDMGLGEAQTDQFALPPLPSRELQRVED